MSITKAQNSTENIRLLVAQHHLYSVAKRYRAWQTTIIIGLAAISPVFVLLPPRWQNLMAVVGVLWTAVSVIAIGRLEEEKIKQAATIQEQFDVGLYGIPWWTASHESARILSISQASPYTPPLDITLG